MAAQEWDWFQREELIGQISDIRVQNLQVERENVQKRTFTRWINLHLEKCNPPLEVKDLFVDIQDGKILMALLEVLSGRNLLHEYKASSHRIFQLNNIAKALKFLEDSNVKLVSIDAAEIADGNPSLVLGLIWNIILFFQIKELTGNLGRSSPSSSLSPGSGGTDSDSSFPPTPTAERSMALSVKDQRKAIRTLLAWVQRKTRKYGVAVQDFAGSWKSGLAFLAVIKAIDPSLVDMKQALEDSMRENLEKAFTIAHDALHIPRLLEPEDIMVDTPDEQSIVTYVAQFLEHFPELEAEDFVDSEKEAPIESTFVRIKETPSERENTVWFLTEDGERAHTVNHETSHPPPAKVFVCDKPESVRGPRLGGLSSQVLSDTATEVIHQVIDRVLRDVPGKTSSIGEPSPESSILSRKDNRGSNHLPIKKSVHFEADTCHSASCSKGTSRSQDSGFAGNPRGTKEVSKQDGYVLEVAEEKPKEDVPSILEAASDEALDDVPLEDSEIGHSLTSQSSPSWNGAWERAASPGEGSRPHSPLGEDMLVADSMEIKVELQTVEAMDKDDYFEGIPLKASKFNSDLADFASTSQAFDEDPLPPDETSEEPAETLGERRSKAAHQWEGSDEPPGKPGKRHPHKVPGQEDQDYFLAPEEVPVDKKPEVHEKAKRKSPRRRRGEEEGEAESPLEPRRELPSNPPSSRVSLDTLMSRSEEGLDFKPSPPLSKISVIPHDLFYYPHYEVPLAAVLEAYAEGTEDLKNEEVDLEEAEGCLYDLGPRVEEEPEASESSRSVSGPDEDQPPSTLQEPNLDRGAEGAEPALEPTPPPAHQDHQQREAEDSAPAESQQESPNSETFANPSEEKVVGEAISSKKKEKKKHVDHVESSIFIAPGTVRSSDDLEDDAGDHRVLSRTSHSDSSIYVRRHTNRSLESDHFSYVQLRNAADQDDRRNRMSTRYNTQKLTELILQFYGIRADKKREGRHARKSMKILIGLEGLKLLERKTSARILPNTQECDPSNSTSLAPKKRKASHPGEAALRESGSLRSDSLTQLVQQPDMVYFILFLWLLVYCLLLFPQLDITRL